MEIPGFENREDSIFKKLLDFFELSEVNCEEQKIYFLALILLKSGMFLIAILMEDTKPVVQVKKDFACRDKSEVIAYYGIFKLSRF